MANSRFEKVKNIEAALNLMTIIKLGSLNLSELIILFDHLENEELERIEQAVSVLLKERQFNKEIT